MRGPRSGHVRLTLFPAQLVAMAHHSPGRADEGCSLGADDPICCPLTVATGRVDQMGESKLPLYAYVDETGNTGHNLFDEAQPDFFTAALITKGDFDLAFEGRTRAIAQELGAQALHERNWASNSWRPSQPI
jgi:hypothetical protein